MATGELTKPVDESELAYGEVITSSGRRSAAKMYEPEAPTSPFTTRQLARLDEALTFASRETGLDFSLYLGELGTDSRAAAEKLHATTSNPANAVLVAVSPGERLIEIVTGKAAYVRLPDRGAKLAVASMVASFKEGDLVRGLVNGLVNALRMLSDQAGPAPR
ncbi:DUF5130 domain-containing protein [Amycolatopsis sp. OK19-0408]|uniref:DUF5130 domain-containing protein n=1 Tax=Amycolatopsis iheyensis TaxID=2945988 RepID=A0A9X2N9J6_9PSEU|nr:DUF5130 domain-containing protein [Amycolatopsis iheyensis]MCR6483463.1 DUF5130 domain-containing protein [Amycolatopsis iheyensis]